MYTVLDRGSLCGRGERLLPRGRWWGGVGVPYLGDDVFELALLPGVCGVVHHGDDGVVELLVLVVQEDQLRPQVGLLGRPQHLIG